MTDCYAQDLDYIFHPCSQMKDYETFKPLHIERAQGSLITLNNGHTIIDAISSWWCKSLGHNHPALKQALLDQANLFEHVIFANTTHDTIIELSKQLVSLMPHFGKVFYAGDGSCAIEIALKMSLHIRSLEGSRSRNQFLALKNGYHGETLAALSVSDCEQYKSPYKNSLLPCRFIKPLYVSSQNDPEWHDASDYWASLEPNLPNNTDEITALIFEPIVQGAGGMRIISADFLNLLCKWAKSYGIHIIADEIMTGFGRTGKPLATHYTTIQPDLLCVSKGITSGWLPFSAVIMTNDIYTYFYDDYTSGKSFLHSHTYSGNALGARLALCTLMILKQERLDERANELQNIMREYWEQIALETNAIHSIRGIGAIIAADLPQDCHPRLGYLIYQKAIELGALLRPLGNTIYWLPPLTVSESTLRELRDITIRAIQAHYPE